MFTDNSFAVKNGEFGTVQIIFDEHAGLDVAVRWDKYNRSRHSNGGKCETGHGWLVSSMYLKHVCDLDFGELSDKHGATIESFLFGL